jgi:transposase-like protein
MTLIMRQASLTRLHELPALVIVKLNCKNCKLRTEHVRIDSGFEGKTRYRCLKCGNTRETSFEVDQEDYPEDDSMPCGVG